MHIQTFETCDDAQNVDNSGKLDSKTIKRLNDQNSSSTNNEYLQNIFAKITIGKRFVIAMIRVWHVHSEAHNFDIINDEFIRNC